MCHISEQQNCNCHQNNLPPVFNLSGLNGRAHTITLDCINSSNNLLLALDTDPGPGNKLGLVEDLFLLCHYTLKRNTAVATVFKCGLMLYVWVDVYYMAVR